MTQLGHHELLERLGQGAMGVVWKARDTRSGEFVALKVLNDTSGGRRFRREFRAAQRLDHPNVVRVIEMGADALDGVERPWFTMELVEGTTLRELIDRDAQGWPPERNSDEWLGARLSLLHQATLGLEHCHAHGVLHRDLKPTNVLVDAEGVVKLVDFGLARVDEHASSLSGVGQLIGTVAYMSPEQARGGSLDARSDVHGLGAVLFELGCATAAFRGDDLPSLLMQVLFQPAPDPLAANPDLEPGLAELAARCLAKDPIDRPQSAREVAEALEALAAARGLVLDGGAASETPGRLRTLRPQLVGRERERQALRDALEAARERPVALTLVGTSGVGKSRLARELRVDAELQGFRVLSSAAFASSRPLGTLRDALAVATRQAGDEARHDVELLATVLPDLLGTEEEADGPAAPADRLRVTWAAEAVLARLLASGPHLLLLDDLQWADALSAQVIEQLIEREEGALLVVGAFRADDAEARPAAQRLQEAFTEKSGGLRIELEPLDEDAVARVVESMLGEAPARDVAAQLRQATGGLPHDIEQIVRELAARGAFRTETEGLSLSLPAGVELSELSASDATRAQLDKMGPAARRILLAVLLSGRGVHVATLARALALDEDLLLDELERLVNEGLLRDGPGRDVVSLAHDRLREAFAIGSSADELGSLRTSLARALEGGDGAQTSLHRVAELDLAASSFDDARRTVPPSAEAFAAAGLHAAAVERYEALISLARTAGQAPPVEARERRAYLLMQSGRTEEAMQAYSDLVDDPETHEFIAPASALRQLGFSLMLLTRNEEAAAKLERALTLADEAGDASDWIRGASVLATVLDRLSDLDRSWSLHQDAVGAARERGQSSDLAMALTNLGVGAYRRGRLAEATAAYQESAALFEELGDEVHAANCQSGHAAVLLARGEPESCRPIAREALAKMRRTVDIRGLSRVLEVLGLASLHLGEIDEAESSLGESLAIRGRLREPWARAESALNLASIAAYRCRWSRAEELLRTARELFAEADDMERCALVDARLGELAWRSRQTVPRSSLESCALEAVDLKADKARGTALLTLARLEADGGEGQAACDRLRLACEAARDFESEEPLQDLESELLTARTLAGDLDGLAEAAEAVAARALQRPVAARLLDWLAAAGALRAAEEPARAAACLQDAEVLLARLRAKLTPEDGERFEAQHAHARLLALARDAEQENEMSTAERTELDRLRTFHSLVMASDPSEPHSLLSTFVSGALEQLGFRRGLVFVAEGTDLACRIALDADGRDIPADERRVPDQLLRNALKRGEPLLSVGVRDDPDVDFEGSVAEMNVEAFAAVPVVTSGGLSLIAYFDGPPPARDVRDSLDRLAPVFQDFGLLLERARRVKARTERADALLSSLGGGEGPIVGSSRAVEDLRRLVQTIAPTDASVLILGENGTGKELVARELHSRSNRSEGPMLSRSCAELTETLLESELFGHEKGAFTGAARDRAGLFEAASGGTLFLDEVGEMTPSLQAKLLRVLETGEVTRIGSTTTRKVDVRVVAATHRDLASEVQEGTFRQDLYYRLKVIEVRVPPLRERRDDLPSLAHHFLALSTATRAGKPSGFTHDALRTLTQHDWPGNVRELRNVVERAVILSGDREEVGRDLLPPELLGDDATATPGGGPAVSGSDLRATKDAFEKACISRALEENDQNRTHAAKALGISVRSLQQKMGRHGVS